VWLAENGILYPKVPDILENKHYSIIMLVCTVEGKHIGAYFSNFLYI
jgi:hypothetical protein